MDDGETKQELDRVLQANQKLRRNNQSLQKALANLRLSGATGGSSSEAYIRAMRGGGGGGGGKKGVKTEWKSSLVDDDMYKKPKPVGKGKKGRQQQQQQQR